MSKPLPPRPEQPAGQKPTAAQPKPEKSKAPKKPSPWPWGPWRRTLFSVLILLHITAVFSAPWAIQTTEETPYPDLPPGRVPRDAQGREIPLAQLSIEEYPPRRPRLAQAIHGVFWHYDNLLYLNNGYDFFAPDPSVAHLIRYEVFDKAGQSIAKGEFPNRQQQWPRLLYHRYMMLVDQSSSPQHQALGWETRIADGLLEYYDGETIRLTKLRHNLLTPKEVLDGRRLNDDATYDTLGELQHRRQPKPAPEPLPQATGGGS